MGTVKIVTYQLEPTMCSTVLNEHQAAFSLRSSKGQTKNSQDRRMSVQCLLCRGVCRKKLLRFLLRVAKDSTLAYNLMKNHSEIILQTFINLLIKYRIVASTNTSYQIFRKSDFLFFKVSNTNMPTFFLGKKLFCLSLDLLDIPAT